MSAVVSNFLEVCVHADHKVKQLFVYFFARNSSYTMQRASLSQSMRPATFFGSRQQLLKTTTTAPQGGCRRAVVRADLLNKLTVALQNSPLAKGKLALAKLQAGSYDEEAISNKLNQLIEQNSVMMFSFRNCPYCRRAKQILGDLGATYEVMELDEVSDGMQLRAQLAEMTGRTSVPNVFIGGKNVGGCTDGPGVATLQARGELEGMLRAVGAL
jgi:glutaredoxin 3